MTSNGFVIASNNEGKSGEELLLQNLRLRLRLQKEAIQKTEDEIEYVENLIKNKKEMD